MSASLHRTLLLGSVLLLVASVAPAQTPESNTLDNAPTLKAAVPDAVWIGLAEWLKSTGADAATTERAQKSWNDSASFALLDRVAIVAAQVDPRAGQLVDLCSHSFSEGVVDPQKWLREGALPPLVRNNLRLFYARWLAQQQLYDELLEQLTDLAPEEVVDPSSLLFYRSVGYHRLLNRDAGLQAIQQLLGNVAEVPQRYRAVASLMQSDLEKLDDKTLDHIARRMDDIRRRLDQARAGQKVVDIENGVIKSLDKLIDEMEKQQQQQGGGGGGGGSRAATPMQDSMPGGGKGEGKTDRKPIGNTAGWGELPPKQREEALQQIGKDFPAHYREVIEQYFRRLATEGSKKP